MSRLATAQKSRYRRRRISGNKLKSKIDVIGIATNNANDDSPTVTIPAAAQNNDVLFVLLQTNLNIVVTPDPELSGFTVGQLAGVDFTTPYRAKPSTMPGSLNFTLAVADRWILSCIVLRNAALPAAGDLQTNATASSENSLTLPSATMPKQGAVIYGLCYDGDPDERGHVSDIEGAQLFEHETGASDIYNMGWWHNAPALAHSIAPTISLTPATTTDRLHSYILPITPS